LRAEGLKFAKFIGCLTEDQIDRFVVLTVGGMGSQIARNEHSYSKLLKRAVLLARKQMSAR